MADVLITEDECLIILEAIDEEIEEITARLKKAQIYRESNGVYQEAQSRKTEWLVQLEKVIRDKGKNALHSWLSENSY